MSAATIHRHLAPAFIAIGLLASAGAAPASAQSKPQPRASSTGARPSRSVSIGGYATFGNIFFTATESFDAILGTTSGPIFGGGARVGLPWGGLFVDVGAWRFHAEGERALVFEGEVIPLGIPVDVTVTPIELSGGWRFRIRSLPKFSPYVAGGLTAMKYHESSDFSTAGDDVDDTFSGYHLLGGAEYKITRWLGVAGEASWTTVPDAIGESGVSAAFNETDLGGTTVRFKITIGR
jgi:Outer membrane protein beta-barrel domain